MVPPTSSASISTEMSHAFPDMSSQRNSWSCRRASGSPKILGVRRCAKSPPGRRGRNDAPSACRLDATDGFGRPMGNGMESGVLRLDVALTAHHGRRADRRTTGVPCDAALRRGEATARLGAALARGCDHRRGREPRSPESAEEPTRARKSPMRLPERCFRVRATAEGADATTAFCEEPQGTSRALRVTIAETGVVATRVGSVLLLAGEVGGVFATPRTSAISATSASRSIDGDPTALGPSSHSSTTGRANRADRRAPDRRSAVHRRSSRRAACRRPGRA